MESGYKFRNVEEYIESFGGRHQELLRVMRETIRDAAPGAVEVISYNMPAFRLHGILVYYAAHKEHIGFYPADAAILETFGKELAGYETSKGAIRFDTGKNIPTELVTKIVTHRVQGNLAKAALKLPGR